MGALLSAILLLYRAQLSAVLRARRTVVACILAALPVLFAMFAITIAERVGPPPAREIGWTLQVQVLVPLLALVLGSSVVAGEVEGRTITYLFTRPIPRAAVLIGRWLAVLTVLLAIQLASAAAMLFTLRTGLWWGVGEELEPGVMGPLLWSVALGSITYSALFSSIGTIVKYPMVVGLGYVFAFEVFLSNLPGSGQDLTVQYYLRSYAWHVGADTWRDMEAFLPVEYEPAAVAVRTLLVLTVGALALGSLAVSRRQYVLPS